ncbi:MAG: Transcriptional attenuator, LytR family, partial [Modestobacter sp.]|nr:Transcriptional attenuator, LytR family [Modestobacter sp.]
MADQPTRNGGHPGAPGGARVPDRSSPAPGATAEGSVTVEELLARTGVVRGRRAERREATGRQQRVDGYGAPAPERPLPVPPRP